MTRPGLVATGRAWQGSALTKRSNSMSENRTNSGSPASSDLALLCGVHSRRSSTARRIESAIRRSAGDLLNYGPWSMRAALFDSYPVVRCDEPGWVHHGWAALDHRAGDRECGRLPRRRRFRRPVRGRARCHGAHRPAARVAASGVDLADVVFAAAGAVISRSLAGRAGRPETVRAPRAGHEAACPDLKGRRSHRGRTGRRPARTSVAVAGEREGRWDGGVAGPAA